MATIPTINELMYSPQNSLILTAITLSEVLVLCTAGFKEIKGTHMQYSKFGNDQPKTVSDLKVSSRVGMLIFYTPALVAAVVALLVFAGEMSARFVLVAAALAIHFLKRDIEVLFIHKFSGKAALDHSVVISTSYTLITTATIYAQYQTTGLPEPPVNLMYVGVLVFFVGISGNFYHHYLLANLRKDGEKQYKIPQGGLFSLVICPHYLFELIGFLGISFISQTIYAFVFTIGMSGYLVGRSYATRKWYMSKFDDFPKDVKALIPYIY